MATLKEASGKPIVVGAKRPVFSEYLSTTLIEDTQNRIIKLKKELDPIAEQMENYKSAYEKLKGDYDTIKAKLDDEDNLLAFLSRHKNGIPEGVDFRVDRAESHNDMKPREQKKLRSYGQDTGGRKMLFNWMHYAEVVLREQKRFIDGDRLYDLVSNKFDIPGILKANDREGQQSKIKWGAINNCWLSNTKSRAAILTRVGDKFGLLEWVDEAGRVKEEYRRAAV